MHIAKNLIKEITVYTENTGEKVLIVPGGSIFADMVRKMNVSDESAHWMAVLAMEQYGYFLADRTPARLVSSISFDGKGTYILLPYTLLREKDVLPHTWDVTSDTIAAWVALQVDARFIKVTDVDGVYIDGVLKNEVNAVDLIGKESCVDNALPEFLMKNKMNCSIVNGNCPGRIVDAFKGNIPGTLIIG